MANPYNRKLTEGLITSIAQAVQIGTHPETAARAFGIGRSTFYRWLERGRAPGPGDHLYVELVDQVEKAKGIFEVINDGNLFQHAKRDPRAAIYIRERMDRIAAARAGVAAAGSGAPTITFVISGKESTSGARTVDPAAAARDLEDPAGAGDPVGSGVAGVGEGRLDEPGDRDTVVIDVQGRAVA